MNRPPATGTADGTPAAAPPASCEPPGTPAAPAPAVPAQAGPPSAPPYDPPGPLERLGSAAFARINRSREWWELPAPLALLNIKVLRDDLRRHNLHDTYGAGGARAPGPGAPRPCTARTTAPATTRTTTTWGASGPGWTATRRCTWPFRSRKGS